MATTSIRIGQKLEIAVPITPGDNTPIDDRDHTRVSKVERIREDGTIEETEGTLRADRMGIDWAPIPEPAAEGSPLLAVIRTTAGPLLGTMLGVKGKFSTFSVEPDGTWPGGEFQAAAASCGQVWDFLAGRPLQEVVATLPKMIDRATGLISETLPGTETAKADPPAKKKRGPKPRAHLATTGETEVLPAAPPPVATVSASDGKISFVQRMRLWHAASELVRLLESDVDDLRVQEAASTVYATVANISAESGRG